MLFDGVEAKVLGVEIEHGEDEREGRVHAQLLALPQVRLTQTRRERRAAFLVDGRHQRFVVRFQSARSSVGQRVSFEFFPHFVEASQFICNDRFPTPKR